MPGLRTPNSYTKLFTYERINLPAVIIRSVALFRVVSSLKAIYHITQKRDVDWQILYVKQWYSAAGCPRFDPKPTSR